MHLHTAALLLALLTLGCGGAAGEPASTGGASSSGDEAAAFTWEQAIAAARAEDAAFIPVEVEVERVEGRTLIEVEGILGDRVVERYYDPASGERVREGVEELGAEERAALPTLRRRLLDGEARLEDALAQARRAYAPEELREVELELHGDRLVLEVEVEREGRRQELVHDPATGARLGGETEGDPERAAP